MQLNNVTCTAIFAALYKQYSILHYAVQYNPFINYPRIASRIRFHIIIRVTKYLLKILNSRNAVAIY